MFRSVPVRGGVSMRRVVVAALATMGVAAATAAADERRELGAHEHGRSTLDVAFEGGRVTMALASPGMDIVGFEHAAGTDEQRAEVERARAALADPLTLFALPTGAGCRVASAELALEVGEEEEHGHGGEHAEKGEEAGGHSEFRAEYALDCAAPGALASLDLAPFFARFPGAEEVEVRLVTARGQSSREATPADPAVRLDPAG
jgi:hypothetical protein